jgi:ABC transporter ATM
VRSGVAKSLREHEVSLGKGYQSMPVSSEGSPPSKSAPSKPASPAPITRVNNHALKPASISTPGSPPNAPQPASLSQPSTTKTAVDLGGDAAHKTNAEQRKADWRIVKNLAGNLWPRGWDPEARSTNIRVLGALGLLAGGKVSR